MISFILPYGDNVRDLVHRVKGGDEDAIIEMASAMAPKIPTDAVIVPMPSHDGTATYSMTLAFHLARMTDGIVIKGLEGKPRASQYRTKKAGGLLRGDDFGLRLSATGAAFRLDEEDRVVIVDDVIGTGQTAKAALAVLPKAKVVAYSMDIKVFYKHNNVTEKCNR